MKFGFENAMHRRIPSDTAPSWDDKDFMNIRVQNLKLQSQSVELFKIKEHTPNQAHAKPELSI